MRTDAISAAAKLSDVSLPITSEASFNPSDNSLAWAVAPSNCLRMMPSAFSIS